MSASSEECKETTNYLETRKDYKKAQTEVINKKINTHSGSWRVQTVSTNRVSGEVKLRIAPKEIPDNIVRKTTR